MSGFEIAGVALGAFPILLEGAKSLRGVYRDAKAWWEFEREFDDFVAAVEWESIAFSQSLDIMLESFADLSTEDRDILHNSPGDCLWLETRIQAELERRIPVEQQRRWFLGELRKLGIVLAELYAMLPATKKMNTGNNDLDSQLYRLRMSFSHKKDAGLAKIRQGNENLHKFLDRNNQVDRMASTTAISSRGQTLGVTKVFLNQQRQARSLYKCFWCRWADSCACAGDHQSSITVQGRDFRLLFGDHADDQTTVRIEVTETGPSNNQPTAISTTPAVVDLDQLYKLRRQLSFRTRCKKAKRRSRRGIKVFASLFNPKRLSSFLVSRFPRQPDVPDDSDASAIGSSSSPSKPPKIPPIRGKHVSFAPTTEENQGAQIVVAAPRPSQEVLAATADFCSIIRKRDTAKRGQNGLQKCLGYIEAGPSTRFLLHLDDYDSPPQPQTLEVFLRTTNRRYDRLRLGHEMILLFLKLGPDWIPEAWSKSAIVILRSSSDVEKNPYPYLSHGSIRASPTSGSQAPISDRQRAKTEACLVSLGIVLLELLFGKSLETLPFRSQFLGADGQPHTFTDRFTALQWQKDVEKEFGNGIAGAIKRCLVCSFEPDADLTSSAFVRAVWEYIARPVEEFARAFR